ncbi:MAG TPA: hypothetical protein VF624_09915, partial [Tepidisphaeraceae bacterium]
VCGLGFTGAALALPWMRLGPAAWIWLTLSAVAIAAVAVLATHRPRRWKWLLAAGGAALLLTFPWAASPGAMGRWVAFVPLLASTAAVLLPIRLRKHAYAMLAAVAVMLTIPLFGSSSTWYTMGFAYGTQKFGHMLTGSGSWNLPAMLRTYFEWGSNPNALVAVPVIGTQVSAHTMMRASYAVALLLCAIGAAVQSARRDTRFLVAVAAPWLVCFMLMTQMHGRYSVWAAGLSALLAGVSVGMALLGVLVAVVAWLGIVQNQYIFVPRYDPQTLALLERLDPHLGLVLALAAGIYLYTALAPRPPLYRRLQCGSRIATERSPGDTP